jgi:chloramphenicol O-acetyltransferase type A
MERSFDIDTWSRREHLELFRSFDLPFFSLCADMDVTAVRELCCGAGTPSYFAATLFLSLTALNEERAFRLRLRDSQPPVICHDVIHASATVLLEDDSFAFSCIELDTSFERFAAGCRTAIEDARRRPVKLATQPGRDDLVYVTVLPWISFTSFAHARRLGRDDSVPRLALGKYRQRHDGRWLMPVSIEAHHALADGLHVGRFFERYQQLLDNAESALAT